MNAQSLVRLIYVSRPVVTGPEEYDSILTTSHRNNGRDYISGALIWRDDFNLQILEGPREAVSSCFIRIASDTRHEQIQVIACTDVPHRLFAEWLMHSIQPTASHTAILNRYSVSTQFDPYSLSQAAAEDLAKTVSEKETLAYQATG